MQEQNKPVNNPAVEEKKQRSLWQEAWRRFRKNRMAMIGLAFILLLVIISISTLVIDAATHNSIYNEFVVKQDLVNRLKGPSAKHIFGQDEFAVICCCVCCGEHVILSSPVVSRLFWHCAQAACWERFQVITEEKQTQSSCE